MNHYYQNHKWPTTWGNVKLFWEQKGHWLLWGLVGIITFALVWNCFKIVNERIIIRDCYEQKYKVNTIPNYKVEPLLQAECVKLNIK